MIGRLPPTWCRGVLCIALSFCAMPLRAQVVRSASGDSAAQITPTRDLFRLDLGGGSVAGANGSFGGLRREINWDGVPAGFAAPNNLPANFFNSNSPRGAFLFTDAGSGFQVSGQPGDSGPGQPVPQDFGNINPGYTAQFQPFSAQRLFTGIGSNVVDVLFFVPGTSTPAAVRGFGAIFTDVDLPNTTSIRLFDVNSQPLGTFFVPPHAGDASLSFLGVSYPTAIIGGVVIRSGNAALGAGVNETAGVDLVVMDDWLDSEPVPEPGSIFLVAGAGVALARGRRRRVG